ncbi:MAG: Hsp20 family protein [Alphaproteobacteria bacterium]|jgi:molecular chaperone IbpA|nr:Hsp20 family protein [Alphaproteobacteria bacterium]QQS57491.1 MAG: Hsp20 family protein [Alphaproteobacteria bacterium]
MTNVLTLTTPLLRQTVGFDRFNDLFESLLRDTSESFDNYPPYNIEKTGAEGYRITMAVAGFQQEDLNIVLQDGVLTVSGRTKKQEDQEGLQILHRGIATRSFERTFRLADYIRVDEADLRDGLLTVSLTRVIPEEKKPRLIPIKDNAVEKAIESKTNSKKV